MYTILYIKYNQGFKGKCQ